MRKNKGLPDVNLWLSSSWPVLLIPAMALPQFLMRFLLSLSLSPQLTHTLPYTHLESPSIPRLKSLIKSNSSESACKWWAERPWGGQCFQEMLVFVWSRSKPEEDKLRPSVPQRHHKVTSHHGTVPLCLLFFPPASTIWIGGKNIF